MDLTAPRTTDDHRLRRPRRNRLDFLIRLIFGTAAIFSCVGCQLGYYIHSAYNQTKLVIRRMPIEKALQSDRLNEVQKAKLRLALEAKKFGETNLGLKPTKNYTSFVQLDEAYVTYIVHASLADELKPYQWYFPFVGNVPYKGYFRKALADEEAAKFDKSEYDTFVRGVSAYSTLGWFQDSVLSSMLRYEDADLVETIIHETLHTTLYIKSATEFNERLATYLGHEGMRLFYLEKEGANSHHLRQAEIEGEDQKHFSSFLTQEFEDLKKWYEQNRNQMNTNLKKQRLSEIQKRFVEKVKPQMRTKIYANFEKLELNNAVLLAYRTYEYSLEDFEKLHVKMDRNFLRTLEWLKGLEKVERPEERLKEFVSGG